MSYSHTNGMLYIRTTQTSWRCSTETSLGVSFETYLRHCWDIQRDVLLPGGLAEAENIFGCIFSIKNHLNMKLGQLINSD